MQQQRLFGAVPSSLFLHLLLLLADLDAPCPAEGLFM